MNNNMNCDKCSTNMRTQMDMRSQRAGMMGRYSQGQMMPRMQGSCDECGNVRVTTGCNDCGTARVANRCDDCGDTTDTLRGKAIAMAYVPWQQFGCTYEPMQGLHAGTIFPELDKPFYGRRGMR